MIIGYLDPWGLSFSEQLKRAPFYELVLLREGPHFVRLGLKSLFVGMGNPKP